ncbi:solute carrier family 22 member 7-like [Trichoplusia ni]|uniref:Solute carrier family 22 member 7-like n=1 Tax=Trichoplusia ni TaxID=7111 RepID=A0A7E5WES8_TRINI|nr:solute carrier family 22 member 7-like [Trichoplusia ni]
METKPEANGKMDTKENMENKKVEEVDKMVQAIGTFEKWQIMLCVMVAFPSRISAAWQQLGIVFVAPATSFQCTETNLTDSIQPATCYKDCVKYEYYTEFENTIISEWDLICERAWMANLTQTLCMAGVLIGSIFFGFVADRFGRRIALLIACVLQLVTGLIEPFSISYWMFTIVRFFIGTSIAGTMLCSFILMMEITGPKRRELMSVLCALPFPVGQMLMPLFSYYLRSWNRFCLGVGIPNLIYLIYFFLLPESPKWLISQGRLEDASKVMTQAARWNNLPSDNMLDVAKAIAYDNANSKDAQQGKATYMDLLRTKVLRVNIVGSCTLWFMLGISFYGSNQYIGQTSSNAFVSVALAGVLQLPGIMLSGILSKKVGRRITLICFFAVCAVSNAFLAVPEDWFIVRLVAGAIGVGCSSGAFATVYMYTTELFPTVTRNMAMGASSTISRVGSMLAPYVAGLTGVAAWLPPAAFAVVPVLGALTLIFLPETRGKILRDHVA